MTEQFLHRANVVPIFKQGGRERVTKNVRTDTLRETRPSYGLRNLFLDHGLVQVKARRWAPLRIAADPRGGKDKLPGPVR